jgi:hypothetical protein
MLALFRIGISSAVAPAETRAPWAAGLSFPFTPDRQARMAYRRLACPSRIAPATDRVFGRLRVFAGPRIAGPCGRPHASVTTGGRYNPFSP